jgi:hypothetical protein
VLGNDNQYDLKEGIDVFYCAFKAQTLELEYPIGPQHIDDHERVPLNQQFVEMFTLGDSQTLLQCTKLDCVICFEPHIACIDSNDSSI